MYSDKNPISCQFATENICSSAVVLNYLSIKIVSLFVFPFSWESRIHPLHLCRGVSPPPNSVLDITVSNLMVRFH